MSRRPAARDPGLEFFGAVTASVSHELNNILSIIEQVAGLLEDELARAAGGQPLRPERLQGIQERIGRQTQRGGDIIRRVNWFAHSVDEPCSTFDLGVLVENLLALTDRIVKLRKVRLTAGYPDARVLVVGSPFRLLQAVFLCLQGFLEDAVADDLVEVSLSLQGNQAALALGGPCRSQETWQQGRAEAVDSLLTTFSGTTETLTTIDRRTVVLQVPAVSG